jgi:hypothetical protein
MKNLGMSHFSLPRRRWLRTAGATTLTALVAPVSRAEPVWGAAVSSSVDTPPSALKPGQWIWAGDQAAAGPMVMVVSLSEQRAYAYRNGLLEAVTTVSSGKPGHRTPTGVFTILQKDRHHHSSLYQNAAMPYQQRLTWDGVALHAGGLPGYPESHGCIHLPTEFARRLFETTTLGMTVVVAAQGQAPEAVVHPSMLAPVQASGAPDVFVATPLAAREDSRWTPERAAASGPVSLVLSSRDQRLVVLRGGVEIGRTRVGLRRADTWSGTHALIVQSVVPGSMPEWVLLGVPGHEGEAGTPLRSAAMDNVSIAPEFVARLLPLLGLGSVLVVTDMAILPHTTGARQRVLDALPPA